MNLPGSEFGTAGPLLLRWLWRYQRRHPWQTWTHFASILLGVMMVVAVDLANESARRAMNLSLAGLHGGISHQLVAGQDGVPDAVFTSLKTDLGIPRAAPSVQGEVRLQGHRLTLVGMDPFSEFNLARGRAGLVDDGAGAAAGFILPGREGGLLVTRETARQFGLGLDQEWVLQVGEQSHTLQLAGLLDSQGSAAADGLLFADIALAQDLLGKAGRLDSIDLVLDETQARQLRAWLPPGISLQTLDQRQAHLDHMTGAFHTNLLAMSFLSLLVAALLIYNTVSLAILQRRHSLGILRGLGLTRKAIFRLVLGESLGLALAASLVGLLLGIVLGRGLVELVTTSFNDLYFRSHVTDFQVAPWLLLKGLLLGLGVTLAAAVLPARQAAQAPPALLTRQSGSPDAPAQGLLLVLWLGGLLLLALGWGLIMLEDGSLVLGFVALTLMIAGACLLIPGLLSRLLSVLLRPLAWRLAASPLLALRGLQQSLGRSGLAVAALAVALSVTVGVGVMVGSFRDTVVLWLDQSMGGDYQVSARGGAGLPAGLQAALGDYPGVVSVLPHWQRQAEAAFGPLTVVASEDFQGRDYLFTEALPGAEQDWLAGAGVLVSEPLAHFQQLAVGGELALQTPVGLQAFTILGIFRDYTTDSGLLAMQGGLYRQIWQQPLPQRLTLATEAGLQDDWQAVLEAWLVQEGGAGLQVVANRQLRELTLEVFDRTFAITHVLRLLAILVAFAGVFCALMAQQMERRRDLAILRASGMTQAQLWGLVLLQTGVMGLAAGLFALPLGLMMSQVLIEVINQRAFGWSMLGTLPPGVLLEALLLGLLAALLAGLYPAHRAARLAPALALREE